MNTRNQSQQGYLILLVLIIISAFFGIGLSVASVVAAKYAHSKQNVYVENAVSAAEAGVTATIAGLNYSQTFTGFPIANPATLYTDPNRGKATYSTTVATNGDGTVTITSIGNTYTTTTAASPANTKTIKAIVQKTQKAFPGSVIAGPGGLFLDNGASVNSAKYAYVMGTINAYNGANIGTAANPMQQMNVANYGCGTSANWPQPCGAGSPPITIVNALHSNKIYGTTCATNQTDGTDIVTLMPNCNAPIAQMPTFDKQSLVAKIKAANPTAMTASSISNQCTSSFFDQTVTVPANTWITGNLNVNATVLGHCRVLFAGDTYFTGSLTLGVWGSLGVADSAGSTKPTIILNGQFNVYGAGGLLSKWGGFRPNASGTVAYVVSFYSSDPAGCSQREDVPSLAVQTCLTPAQGQQSAMTTGFTYEGIHIGNGSADLAGALYYAYYGVAAVYNANLLYPQTVNAIGGQGIDAYADSNVNIMSTETSPFGQILTVPVYTVVDYQQVY